MKFAITKREDSMRGRRLWMAALAVVPLMLFSTAALAAVEIHVFYGQKQMDSKVEPVDTPPVYGLGASFGGSTWPVMLAVDVATTSDDDTCTYDYYGYTATYKYEVDTTEINVGVRKFWGEKFRGYLGGGISYIDSSVKVQITDVDFPSRQELPFTLVDDSDSATGYWLQGGIGWQFSKMLSVNGQWTYTNADIEITGEEINGNGNGSPTRQEPSSYKEDVKAGGNRLELMLGIRF
jgi:hypothetical protein